jgi:hypothetical protein
VEDKMVLLTVDELKAFSRKFDEIHRRGLVGIMEGDAHISPKDFLRLASTRSESITASEHEGGIHLHMNLDGFGLTTVISQDCLR